MLLFCVCVYKNKKIKITTANSSLLGKNTQLQIRQQIFLSGELHTKDQKRLYANFFLSDNGRLQHQYLLSSNVV